MFTNILAPVDGSQHSIRAALTAVDIAEKYKARVTLLHVINVNQFTGLGSLQAPPQSPRRWWTTCKRPATLSSMTL